MTLSYFLSLQRLSDASGEIEFKKEKEGHLSNGDLDTNVSSLNQQDIYVLNVTGTAHI